MRRLEALAMGLMLAVLALGVSVRLLTVPAFTAAASERYSNAAAAGLSRLETTELALQVRAFVVDGEGTLPARVGDRAGFDASAVSHLEDVNAVLDAAGIATVVLAALAASWVIACIQRRRLDQLAAGLRAGALFSAGMVLLAGAAGLLDFDAFFSAFHGVFFAAGTWTFPADSLLILLFPQPFWALSGAAWALLVGALAGVMWLGAGWAARAARRPEA